MAKVNTISFGDEGECITQIPERSIVSFETTGGSVVFGGSAGAHILALLEKRNHRLSQFADPDLE